jgi:hypothetical protein
MEGLHLRAGVASLHSVRLSVGQTGESGEVSRIVSRRTIRMFGGVPHAGW